MKKIPDHAPARSIRLSTDTKPTEASSYSDCILLRMPDEWPEDPLLTIRIEEGEITLGREAAMKLTGMLQLFYNEGVVDTRNNGTRGFGAGSYLELAMLRSNLSWEKQGIYVVCPTHIKSSSGEYLHDVEAERLGRDIMYELEKQGPTPVLAVYIVPHPVKLPWRGEEP